MRTGVSEGLQTVWTVPVLSGSLVVQCWVCLKPPPNFPPLQINPHSPTADGSGLAPPWLSWEHQGGRDAMPRLPGHAGPCAGSLVPPVPTPRQLRVPPIPAGTDPGSVTHAQCSSCLSPQPTQPGTPRFAFSLLPDLHARTNSCGNYSNKSMGQTRWVNPAMRTLFYLGSCVSPKGRCKFQGNATFLLIIFTFLHWFFRDGIYRGALRSGIKWWNSPPWQRIQPNAPSTGSQGCIKSRQQWELQTDLMATGQYQ